MKYVKKWAAATTLATILLPGVAVPETCISPYIKGLRQPEKSCIFGHCLVAKVPTSLA